MGQSNYDKLKEQIGNAKREQFNKHETIVMDVLLGGGTPDEVSAAHTEYIKSLGMFDVEAYEKVINHILEDDDQTIDRFTTSFRYIPDYINQRNNWSDKRLEAINADGDVASRQAMFDTMDRNRTRAHNGVISLFNDMNRYAKANDINLPYPTEYGTFDHSSPMHREDVAQILTRNTTLLEISNLFVAEQFQERGNTETEIDRVRKMSLTELYEYAKVKSLEKSVDELTESAQEEGYEL